MMQPNGLKHRHRYDQHMYTRCTVVLELFRPRVLRCSRLLIYDMNAHRLRLNEIERLRNR